MLKIRIYSPFFPYPPDQGASQVIFNQLVALHELGHSVELVCWKNSRSETEELQARPSLLPFPPKTPIQAWEAPRLSRPTRVFTSLFSQTASPELHYYPPLPRPELPIADLGIYHYSFAHPWLKRPSPETRRAVLFHNLESELFEARARDARGIRARFFAATAKKLRRHEEELARTEECWFLSPRDQARLAARRARWAGPTYPEAFARARRQAANGAARPDRVIAGFIGNLEHLPNRAGAEWITRELAPLLARADFRGEIRIAGRGAPADLVREASAYPFIRWLGFVPNAEEFWAELSYLLSPHLFGSGTRTKILEAIASGIPILCHPTALEGLHPSLTQYAGVHARERAEEWATLLCSAQAFEERTARSVEPAPPELSAEGVYGFLGRRSRRP